MSAATDILRRAKRLKRTELSRLVKQLEAHLSSTANGAGSARTVLQKRAAPLSNSTRSKRTRKRIEISYARALAWAGTAGSGLSDVSENKGKYLAEAYMARRDV
jgi:hypothetical protein